MIGAHPVLDVEYDNMLRCIRCAACLTSCPTYVTTHKEEEGPRGRIAIMRAIVEGHLDVTPDAIEHLDNCILCEACTSICPAGVQMESMGVAFREALSAEKRTRPPLVARLAFAWLFGDLGHFRWLVRLIWLYQRSGLQWLTRRLGILRVLGMRDVEAMLPTMPGRFVVPRGQTYPASEPQPRALSDAAAGDAGAPDQAEPVQVFAGCMMSTAFAPTTESMLGLLDVFGARAELTRGQVCCGALQAHTGAVDRARELARQNVAAFGDGNAPIIVNAAGCGAMLKHYGQLLPDEPRAAALSARVRDVSEFLAPREPRRPARALEMTVTVQDACHLLHAQRVSAAPRTLLRRIPGLELRELTEPEICCGSGALYNVSHPAMAAQLRERKCANIGATGAEVVVTGNPGCLLQIQSGLPQTVRARHIVDVLADAYLDQSPGAVQS